MFKKSKIIVSCLVIILMLSSMSLVALAGGWDVSSASSWAQEEIEHAFSYDLVPRRVDGDFQKQITRAEFASLVVRLYEKLTEKNATAASRSTFTDTTDQDVLKAYGLGIVSGKGNGTFEPNALVTRQEMAIMYYKALDKAYNALGKTLSQTDGILTVNDKSQVAAWASKYVDFVYENGIITGSGGNFSPLGNAPREQAIVVLKRVYEKYKVDPKFKIQKDGTGLENFICYGGSAENIEGYLKISSGYGSTGPLVIGADSNINPVTAGNGIYEVEFKFDTAKWDAGISFNVSSPKVGVDQFKGYYAGINIEADEVYVGKANYNWQRIETAKLPFDVQTDRYYNLKVVKLQNRIDVYVDNVKYISTTDDTYNSGYFGPRVHETSATFSYAGYNKEMGSLTPKYFGIANTDGDKLTFLRRYSGEWKIGETLTLIDSGKKAGPLVVPIKSDNTLELFPSSAIYEAKFNFKEFNDGNAGFAFNVSDPKPGNDQYKGYYVGVNWKNNSVQVGKSNYKWTNLKEEKIPFSIANGKITLRVEKVFSEITVYVNGRKIVTVTDDTYKEDGSFGPRVWNTDAEYEYLKVEKLPF